MAVSPFISQPASEGSMLDSTVPKGKESVAKNASELTEQINASVRQKYVKGIDDPPCLAR